MEEKDKDLLFKDLSGRLPHGLKVAHVTLSDYMPKVWDVIGLPGDGLIDIIVPEKYRFAAVPIEEIKPYLRPMSSMTEEEIDEWRTLVDVTQNWITIGTIQNAIDFFNVHHFDYRGLIPMGLALEAPEEMYK